MLFDAVIGLDASPRQVKAALDDLIRLRAVQDFTPSQAVGPLFLLKDILRTALLDPGFRRTERQDGPVRPRGTPPRRPSAGEILDGCFEAEARLDSLALLALDLYAADRERIFRMRVDEVKRASPRCCAGRSARGCRRKGAETPVPEKGTRSAGVPRRTRACIGLRRQRIGRDNPRRREILFLKPSIRGVVE